MPSARSNKPSALLFNFITQHPPSRSRRRGANRMGGSTVDRRTRTGLPGGTVGRTVGRPRPVRAPESISPDGNPAGRSRRSERSAHDRRHPDERSRVPFAASRLSRVSLPQSLPLPSPPGYPAAHAGPSPASGRRHAARANPRVRSRRTTTDHPLRGAAIVRGLRRPLPPRAPGVGDHTASQPCMVHPSHELCVIDGECWRRDAGLCRGFFF